MNSPAETYERYMVPAVFAPLAARVLEVAGSQPGERVLDAACGTGIVARRATALVGVHGQVVGLDLSPGMLAVARAVAEQERVTIDWREGRVEALPFPDGGFDLVVCQHGLQFASDPPVAVAEMRRVLRADGRLVVSVQQPLDRHPFDRRLDTVLQKRLDVAALRDIYALSADDELRALLADAGLRNIEVNPITIAARYPDPQQYLTLRLTSVIAAVPTLQHLDNRGREELIAAIGREMAQPLRAHTVGEELVIPAHVQIARAVR
jgi:ubiquinone/menaquinone biosynthesis C-methylase UbiE